VLEGQTRKHASVWVRTRRDRTVSSFVAAFFGADWVEAAGVADAATFSDRWLSCVEAVANRRHEIGLA
jgi:hypothetical protein